MSRVATDDGLHRSPDAREQAREQRQRARSRRRGEPEATLLRSRWEQALLAAVGLLAVLTVGGLVALWPHGGGHRGPSQAMGGATQGAPDASAERLYWLTVNW